MIPGWLEETLLAGLVMCVEFLFGQNQLALAGDAQGVDLTFMLNPELLFSLKKVAGLHIRHVTSCLL